MTEPVGFKPAVPQPMESLQVTRGGFLGIGTHQEDAKSIDGLREALTNIANNTVREERTERWSNWTGISGAFAFIAMCFQSVWEARSGSQRADAALSALKTAGVAQAKLPKHRISDLKEHAGRVAAAREGAESPVAAEMLGHTDPVNAMAAMRLQGSDHSEGVIKQLADALVQIGGADLGFIKPVLDVMRPVHDDGVLLGVKGLNGVPVVLTHEGFHTLQKNVLEQTGQAMLENAYANSPTTPSVEDVYKSLTEYAINICGYHEMPGLTPNLTGAEIKTEMERLGIVEQFMHDFKVRAVSTESTPGAGSVVAQSMRAAVEGFREATDVSGDIQAFTASIQAKTKELEGLESEYKKLAEALREKLCTRDTLVSNKVAASEADRVALENGAARFEVRVLDARTSPEKALVDLRGEQPELDESIKSLLEEIRGVHEKTEAAKAHLESEQSKLDEAVAAKAAEAAAHYDMIMAQAEGISADGGVELKDGTLLDTADKVLEHLGITFPGKYFGGDAISKASVEAVLREDIKVSPEYVTSTLAALHQAMHAQALHNGIEAYNFTTLFNAPNAGEVFDEISAGFGEAQYLEFAGTSGDFYSAVKALLGDKFAKIYLKHVWREISHQSESGERTLKAEYAASACFQGYHGHEHAEKLLRDDASNVALRTAAQHLVADCANTIKTLIRRGFLQSTKAKAQAEAKAGANQVARLFQEHLNQKAEETAATRIQAAARGFMARRPDAAAADSAASSHAGSVAGASEPAPVSVVGGSSEPAPASDAGSVASAPHLTTDPVMAGMDLSGTGRAGRASSV